MNDAFTIDARDLSTCITHVVRAFRGRIGNEAATFKYGAKVNVSEEEGRLHFTATNGVVLFDASIPYGMIGDVPAPFRKIAGCTFELLHMREVNAEARKAKRRGTNAVLRIHRDSPGPSFTVTFENPEASVFIYDAYPFPHWRRLTEKYGDAQTSEVTFDLPALTALVAPFAKGESTRKETLALQFGPTGRMLARVLGDVENPVLASLEIDSASEFRGKDRRKVFVASMDPVLFRKAVADFATPTATLSIRHKASREDEDGRTFGVFERNQLVFRPEGRDETGPMFLSLVMPRSLPFRLPVDPAAKVVPHPPVDRPLARGK